MKPTENPFAQATFLKSVAQPNQLPADRGAEVAIAGRSNSGKSSAINAICNRKNLARTSKTPGRTQTLNLFGLNDDQRLVDLPGYGYAKVPEAMQRQWQKLLQRYLGNRDCLRGLLITMDIRHPLTEYDHLLLDFAAQTALPTHILLTKADKLGRGAMGQALKEVQNVLASDYPDCSVQTFSAVNKLNVANAREQLHHWLGTPDNAETSPAIKQE